MIRKLVYNVIRGTIEEVLEYYNKMLWPSKERFRGNGFYQFNEEMTIEYQLENRRKEQMMIMVFYIEQRSVGDEIVMEVKSDIVILDKEVMTKERMIENIIGKSAR